MPGETIAVELRLHADSPEDLERFGLDLKRDLDDLPDAELSMAHAAAPVGSKSFGDIDWTQLLLALAASGGALTALIGLIQSHLSRDRKVRLVIDGDELELSGLDQEQQQRLIDAWLARRGDKPGRRG